MSWQSWYVGNDLRQQIQDSDRKGALERHLKCMSWHAAAEVQDQ